MTIDDLLLQNIVKDNDEEISVYTLLENLKQSSLKIKTRELLKKLRIEGNKIISFSAFYEYYMMHFNFIVREYGYNNCYFYSTSRMIDAHSSNFPREINELFDLYQEYLKIMCYPKFKTYQEVINEFYSMRISFPFEAEPNIDFKLINDRGELIDVNSKYLDSLSKRIAINKTSLHVGFDYVLVQNEGKKKSKCKKRLFK